MQTPTSSTNISPLIEREVHVFAYDAQVRHYDSGEVVDGLWQPAGVAAACAPVRRSGSEVFGAGCALVGRVRPDAAVVAGTFRHSGGSRGVRVCLPWVPEISVPVRYARVVAVQSCCGMAMGYCRLVA